MTEIDLSAIPTEFQDLARAILSSNYSKPLIDYIYPLRDEFSKSRYRHLFDSAKLSVNNLPTQSILIKSEKRNIGKTLLMRAWKEHLSNENKKIKSSQDEYIRREDRGEIKNWLVEFSKDLKQYGFVWFSEREANMYFSQIENDRENYFNFKYTPKYFFLDDFCYENSYNFEGGKLSQDFINFMRQLLEWLCNNKERIIVIASTNNNPARILCPEIKLLPDNMDKKIRAEIVAKIKSESSLYTRFDEIFKKENRIEIL